MIFPNNKVNYVLRTYLPPWKYEERLEEIIRFCAETDTHHVLLFSDAQFMVWNQLTLDEAKRFSEMVVKTQNRLNERGIRVGVNTSYNMRMSRWDHRGHLDYDHWATFADGSCDYRTPCLLDPKLETYLNSFYGILAQAKPDFIFVDDDHRYMLFGQQNTWGCFCDLHLNEFGKLTNTNWTRPTLSTALIKDLSTRKKWIEFLGERLTSLATIIRKSIQEVSEDIEVGMMVPCVHTLPPYGHNIKNVLGSLNKGDKPLIRPCIGGYNDHNRRQLVAGLFYPEYIRFTLGDKAIYTPEIENCPFTRFSKGMAATRFQIIQAILNGMNSPLLTASSYNGDSPYFEPAYPEMLKESRPFFEKLRETAASPESRTGIQFIWSLESAKVATKEIAKPQELYLSAFDCHEIFGNMGFPITYADSPVKLLVGESVRTFDAETINQWLSQNLILDAHAIRSLIDMGFSEMIGCEQTVPLKFFGSEKCVDGNFFGEYIETFIPLSQVADKATWKLVISDDTHEISTIMNQEFEKLSPGVVLFKNKLGGKICLLPYSIVHPEPNPAHMICYQRREMLRNVVNWMSKDALPVFSKYPAEILTQTWNDSGKIVIALTNVSIDVVDKLSLTSIYDLDSFSYLDECGKNQNLSEIIKRTTGNEWCLKHPLNPFTPLIIHTN